MFESFNDTSAAKRSRRGLAASTMVAAIVYAGAGSVLVAFATTKVVPEDKMVEVTFEKLVPKKALPPPPPPPPKVRKVVATVAAPRIQELIAPKEVPKEKPPEKDEKVVAQAGSGDGIPGGQYGTGPATPEPPPPPPPPPKPKKLEPISLPEEAEPPVADPANAAPGYPEAARAAGLEGRVILKIVISETGAVTSVTVMRGDPILAAAAVAVVKEWKFTPAMLEGKPIAVFRIVPINFSSKVGGAG